MTDDDFRREDETNHPKPKHTIKPFVCACVIIATLICGVLNADHMLATLFTGTVFLLTGLWLLRRL